MGLDFHIDSAIKLSHIHAALVGGRLLDSACVLYYAPPHRAEALSDDARLTTDVCLTSAVRRLSRTSGLSREQRGLRRLKLAQR